MTPMTIYPYLLEDDRTWAFDDQRTQLKAEPFVLGMSDMITKIVELKKLPKAFDGFELTFSAMPFDGQDVRLRWIDRITAAKIRGMSIPTQEGYGTWYQGVVGGELMTGWLCPALLCYFSSPPKEIHVRARELPRGTKVKWKPKRGETFKRFIDAGIRNHNEGSK